MCEKRQSRAFFIDVLDISFLIYWFILTWNCNYFDNTIYFIELHVIQYLDSIRLNENLMNFNDTPLQ